MCTVTDISQCSATKQVQFYNLVCAEEHKCHYQTSFLSIVANWRNTYIIRIHVLVFASIVKTLIDTYTQLNIFCEVF